METLTVCVNCQQEGVGNYCGNCGQRYEIKKLTWGSIFSDLQQRLFGFDSRFIRTVWTMFAKPESVIKSFLQGVRVEYVGPVGYYFLLLTIFLIVMSMLEIDMMEYASTVANQFNPGNVDQQAQEGILEKVFSNFRLVAFLLIPWNVLAIRMLFYKSKLNLVENAVVVLYSQAHPMVFSIVGLFLFRFANLDSTLSYVSILSYTYFAYSYARFFKHNHPVWAFIKGIFSTVLGLLFFAIFMNIVTLIFLLIDPEGFKQIMGIP